jgi:hypothetical protein
MGPTVGPAVVSVLAFNVCLTSLMNEPDPQYFVPSKLAQMVTQGGGRFESRTDTAYAVFARFLQENSGTDM